MKAATAKRLAASKGFELWWDRSTRVWYVQAGDAMDPMRAAALRDLSAGSLRALSAADFERVYLYPPEAELSRWTDDIGLVLKRRAPPAGMIDAQNDAVELGMPELADAKPKRRPKRR